MSTFIINLNDTVALNDSTLIELVKVANSCQSCVQEAATNYDDVRIVAIICAAIVIVALIAWGIIFSLKCKDFSIKEKDKKDKETKTKEESKNRADADLKQRKIDLQNKLLTFLEKNTSKEDYKEDLDKTIKTMREMDSDESQYYIHVLKALIEDEDIPEYTKSKKQ